MLLKPNRCLNGLLGAVTLHFASALARLELAHNPFALRVHRLVSSIPMANVMPTRPRQMMSQRRTFAVVASQYNPTYVQGLVDNFQKELAVVAPGVSAPVYEVPGAFEIPLVVQELAERGGVDAIVAFGVVIQG